MIQGWRARLHYWSRRGNFLKKAACILVLGGFAIAWLIVALTPDHGVGVSMDPLEQKIRNDWQHLKNARDPEPRALAHWLRQIMPNMQTLAESLGMEMPTLESYEKSGELLAYEVRTLLSSHASAPGLQMLMRDYITACLAEKQPQGAEAMKRVAEQAGREVPMPFSNELHASLLLRTDHDVDALHAIMREATLFADALRAREMAARLALNLKDRETLARIVKAGWLTAMPPITEHLVGVQMGDLLMQWRGLLRDRLQRLPLSALLLATLAAALWYIILVQHTVEMPWRWVWPVLPLVAGVASIWPTLSMVAWQEHAMGLRDDAPFPWDMWQLIIGVGLREELCKLMLAALFMPWLVWKRQPGMALMTGAFVGLGFAWEENIDYYLEAEYGEGIAVVRLLSANFLHVAMTGLTTHALYDMLRTRFHRAQSFLSTFFFIVIVHAVYDYELPESIGLGAYLPFIILALVAWQFWDAVEAELPHSKQRISPAAVFLLGTALLIATSFIFSAVLSPTREALVGNAAECASFLPVAVIYWRRFEGELTSR